MRAAVIALVVLLPLASLVAPADFLRFIGGMTLISMFWATGLNLLYGFTGLIPLAFAGLAGIAGYITVHLVMDYGMSFWLALPIGALAASLVGALLSLPAIRLRGFYFALSGIVVQSAMTIAFVYFPAFTNGDTGITSIPRPTFFGTPIASPWMECVLAAFVLALAGITWKIVHSRFGETLLLIREDEDLARALGINVTVNRMVAFLFSSFVAGVGGGLYAHYVGFTSPRAYDVLISLNIWLMVALGGRATIVGPLLGALILSPLPYLLQQYTWVKDVIYGAAIVIVTMFLPQGIYGYILGRRRKP